MGKYIEGILFYGFQFWDGDDDHREDLPWEKDSGDWDDYLVKKLGLQEIDSIPYKDNEEVYKKYWEDKKELVEASSCKIGYHGWDASKMYVYSKEFLSEVGELTEINFQELHVEEVYEKLEQELKEFCQMMNIPWQKPRWYLASLGN